MISRQKNKKNYISRFIYGCIAVLILFKIFNINVTDGVFKNSFNYILETKSGILSPLRNMFGYLKNKSTLNEQVQKLQSENTNLKLDLLTSQTVAEGFEQYRKEFGEFSTNTVPTKVILKPPFIPFDIVRISGDLKSYTIGNLVFYKNILVGKIIEITDQYASVELFSTPNKITPVSIAGSQFEAKGMGGGRYILETPKDFVVSEGEAVLYPNEKVVILGVIEKIESTETDLFKKIYFNVPVPISAMTFLTIETNIYEQVQSTE